MSPTVAANRAPGANAAMAQEPASTLALLEQEANRLGDCGSSYDDAHPPVPRELWERALVRPARDILARPGKEFRRRLVDAAYGLAGGRGDAPVEVGLAIEIIHAGSMIVDDIEDGSRERRGGPAVHVLHGVPLALNAGNWMYFWPLDLVGGLGLSAHAELALHRAMTRAMKDCHAGQALDLSVRVGEAARRELPAVVATATDLKTGALMQLAAEMGAIVAGASLERRATIARFGRRLGQGLQMLDDLGNLWGNRDRGKQREDLRLGRPTWPWAWAAELMDDENFGALQASSRAVVAAATALPREAPVPGVEPLAANLLAAVAVSRTRQVHDHLAQALGALEQALGGSPIVDGLAREVARLESSYV